VAHQPHQHYQRTAGARRSERHRISAQKHQSTPVAGWLSLSRLALSLSL